MKYLEMKKRAFMSIVNKVKGFIRTVSGTPPLTLPDCVDEDSLINYTIEGNSIQSILPKGYQSVEYIESTGTQYIDTEVIANQNTGFEIEFLTKNTIGESGYGSIFGARTSSMKDEYQLTTYTTGNTQGTLRFGTASYDGGIQGKSTISLKNSVYTKSDGGEVTLDGTFTTPCSLALFALNQNGTPIQYGSLQLFSFKLYDGDTLLRDFVPCYRIVDDIVGLYDLVNNKFYENKGSGSFSKGNAVTATPTPEEPIEVEFVGDKTENLMKYPHVATTKTTNGVTFTDNGDGTVTVNGTATANASYALLDMQNITDTTKKYYVSGCPLVSNASKCILVGIYSEGAWKAERYEKGSGLLIDLSSFDYNVDRLTFSIFIYKGQTVDNWTFKPMLVEGDTPKEFEPYNKYKIPVKASGKNLLPFKDNINFTVGGLTYSTKNGELYVNGTSVGEIYRNNAAFINNFSFTLKAGTYILRQAKGIRITTSISAVEDNTHLAVVNGNNLLSATFTLEKDTVVNLGFYQYQLVFDNVKLPIMLSYKDTTDDYEPYVEPITTNIYLDEPLRKISEYSDYIDFENQKLVRNVNEVVFDGSIKFREWIYNEKLLGFLKYISDSVSEQLVLTTHFKQHTGNLPDYFDESAKIKWRDLYIGTDNWANAESFNQWLVEQYNLGKPLKVQYGLETPTETNIVLPKLPTFKGTTIYSVDTKINPSNMNATYYSSMKGE